MNELATAKLWEMSRKITEGEIDESGPEMAEIMAVRDILNEDSTDDIIVR